MLSSLTAPWRGFADCPRTKSGAAMLISLLLGLALAPEASAATLSPQILMKVHSRIHLEGDGDWDFGVFTSGLMITSGSPLSFWYVGPGKQITPWWWSSVRPGIVFNFPTGGDAMPIISWWNSLDPTDDFSFFLEGDYYPVSLKGSDPIYYGYYGASYTPKIFDLGVQAEQVNLSLTAGPHALIKLGKFITTGAEYYWDFKKGHTVRIIFDVGADM